MTQQESSLIVGRRKVDLPEIDVVEPDSPVIGRRELKIVGAEIKIGDELPPQYQEVINEVKRRSKSTTFAKQAELAVYYFYALDKGLKLIDTDGKPLDLEKYADLISSLHFISIMYVRQKRKSNTSPDIDQENQQTRTGGHTVIRSRVSIDLGNPETSFPNWVQARREYEAPENGEYTQLHEFYENWVTDHSIEQEKGRHGLYASYPENYSPDVSNYKDGFFKGYVEIETDKDLLEKAFNQLRSLHIHPQTSKIFDGSRIVLYWNSDLSDQLISQIKSVFEEFGVAFRGPGQDSVGLVLNEDGSLDEEVRTSNDGALGEGGHMQDFRQTDFSPTVFLKTYLEQCYRYWRNPLDPYQLSFIPAFDKRKNGDVSPLTEQESLYLHELVVFDEWVPRLFQ